MARLIFFYSAFLIINSLIYKTTIQSILHFILLDRVKLSSILLSFYNIWKHIFSIFFSLFFYLFLFYDIPKISLSLVLGEYEIDSVLKNATREWDSNPGLLEERYRRYHSFTEVAFTSVKFTRKYDSKEIKNRTWKNSDTDW